MSSDKDIILRLKERHRDIPEDDLKDMVASVFSEISNGLRDGDRVEIRNFGSFSLRKRKFSSKSSLKRDNNIGDRQINVVYFRSSRGLLKKIDVTR
jgi:integration host factor subunit beta